MVLENKLGIKNQLKLNRVEEWLSKMKIKDLYDSGEINCIEVGTSKGLSDIHKYLYEDIYFFAGKVRKVNIVNGNFRFAPVMYLSHSLEHINTMLQTTFDEIIEKYVEMNIAHPFREGNSRATRIWLDLIFKNEIQQVVDWNGIDKEDYLLAMELSPIKDIEIKHLLQNALVDKINSREVFMKGIDISYYYEGYTEYDIEDL
ncbi:TPA: Fic family protein [Bacillus cereus]|nr:Fic family protein [Bacillus cereus]